MSFTVPIVKYVEKELNIGDTFYTHEGFPRLIARDLDTSYIKSVDLEQGNIMTNFPTIEHVAEFYEDDIASIIKAPKKNNSVPPAIVTIKERTDKEVTAGDCIVLGIGTKRFITRNGDYYYAWNECGYMARKNDSLKKMMIGYMIDENFGGITDVIKRPL